MESDLLEQTLSIQVLEPAGIDPRGAVLRPSDSSPPSLGPSSP